MQFSDARSFVGDTQTERDKPLKCKFASYTTQAEASAAMAGAE
jgi:hypothetical protein